MFDFAKARLPRGSAKEVVRSGEWTQVETDPQIAEKSKKEVYYPSKPIAQTSKGKPIYSPLRLRHDTKSERCDLIGSLHCHVQGGFNYRDFGYEDLCRSLGEVSRLGIPLNESVLENIEFGVNISFCGQRLTNGLLYHEGARFKHTKTRDPLSRYVVAQHGRYELKAYDKAAQNKLKYALSRMEIHVNAMRHLMTEDLPSGLLVPSRKGTSQRFHVTLADLLRADLIEYMSGLVLKHFSECIYYDKSLRLNELTRNHQVKTKDWRNPNYWPDLTRNTRCRQRSTYSEAVANHSDNEFDSILELMKDKLHEFAEESTIYTGVDPIGLGTIYTTNPDPSMSTLYTSSYGSNPYPSTSAGINHEIQPNEDFYSDAQEDDSNESVCDITGEPLTGQRRGSKRLGLSGWRRMSETDPIRFCVYVNAFLAEKSQGKDIETVCKMLAVYLKNRKHNPKNNKLALIKKRAKRPSLTRSEQRQTV